MLTKISAALTKISKCSSGETSLHVQKDRAEAIKGKILIMQTFLGLVQEQAPDIDAYVDTLEAVKALTDPSVNVSVSHEEYAIALLARQCMIFRDFKALGLLITGTHDSFAAFFESASYEPMPGTSVMQEKRRLAQTIFEESVLEVTSKLLMADTSHHPSPNKEVLLDLNMMISGLAPDAVLVDKRECMELATLATMCDPSKVSITQLNAAIADTIRTHVLGSSAAGPLLRFLMESGVGLRLVSEASAMAASRKEELQCDKVLAECKELSGKVEASGGFYFMHDDNISINIEAKAFDMAPLTDYLLKEKELAECVSTLANRKMRGVMLEKAKACGHNVWSIMATSFEAMNFQTYIEVASDVISALDQESSY